MGYKNNDTCLNKALDNELIFVLLTRDTTAPVVILEWIKQNLMVQPPDKLREAFETAMKMIESKPAIDRDRFFKKRNVIVEDVCPTCQGTGVSDPGGSINCLSCNGTGLKVPKEIDTFDPDQLTD